MALKKKIREQKKKKKKILLHVAEATETEGQEKEEKEKSWVDAQSGTLAPPGGSRRKQLEVVPVALLIRMAPARLV